jgi:hypothetical protein
MTSVQYILFLNTVFLYTWNCICTYLKDNQKLNKQRYQDEPANFGATKQRFGGEQWTGVSEERF